MTVRVTESPLRMGESSESLSLVLCPHGAVGLVGDGQGENRENQGGKDNFLLGEGGFGVGSVVGKWEKSQRN